MRRQIPLLTGVLLLACAGGQSTGSAVAAEQRQRVQNLTPFDIGTCFPSKVEVARIANEYTLQASFRAARPAINECLTDARVQNGTTATKGKATMSIDATGTTVTVTGDGLQPTAIRCIESAIRTQVEGITAPSGAKPYSLEGPFEREPNTMVRMGINEASDVEGAIRLGAPQWCSCFEPVKTQAPPELIGSVTVTRADGKNAPDGGASKSVGRGPPVLRSVRSAGGELREPADRVAAPEDQHRSADRPGAASPPQLPGPGGDDGHHQSAGPVRPDRRGP